MDSIIYFFISIRTPHATPYVTSDVTPKTLHHGSKQSLNGVEGQQYILAQYALGSNLSRATVETIFNNGQKKTIFKVFFVRKKTYLRLVPLTNLPIKIGQPPHKIDVLVWYGGLMTTVLKVRFQM